MIGYKNIDKISLFFVFHEDMKTCLAHAHVYPVSSHIKNKYQTFHHLSEIDHYSQ